MRRSSSNAKEGDRDGEKIWCVLGVVFSNSPYTILN